MVSSPSQPECYCDAAAAAAVPQRLYGYVYRVVCFKHQCVTPQADAWLRTLPDLKYSAGAIGVSRCGKSTLMNSLAVKLASYVRAAPAAAQAPFSLPGTLERFEISDKPNPQTKGIHAMAIPRFCDSQLNQLSAADGCFLIVDAEGQDLGNTMDHRAILGIVSRLVTQLSYLESSQFNYSAIRSLGRLIASNMIINAKGGNNASPQASWPSLSIVVNKYSLAPPQPDHATWIASMLQPNSGDPANDKDREAVANIWLSQQKLLYHTIPIDPLVTQPSWAAGLPPSAIQVIRQAVDSAVDTWAAAVVRNCSPYTLRYVAGAPLAGTSSSPAISGATFCTFLNGLVQSYATTGTIHVAGALETAINAICDVAIVEALQQYDADKGKAPYGLSVGANDVDGARGTADDGAARTLRNALQPRHDALAAACKSSYVTALSTYAGIGYDTDIALKSQALDLKLAAKLSVLFQHWDRMRSFDPTRTSIEHSHEDGPQFQRVQHTEDEQVWFHTVTHYFWASYLHRWSTTRTVQYRYNGDRVEGPWQRIGSPVEVLASGPWLGGRP